MITSHNLPHLLIVSVNLQHHRKCISIHNMQFWKTAIAKSLVPSPYYRNSRIFRAVIIDNIQHESEERFFTILPGACPLVVGTHWLVAVAVSVTQLSDTVSQQK